MNHSNKAVTIINRHYPPDKGITGESARDLAKYLLEEHQIEVVIVHSKKKDFGGAVSKSPIGKVYEVPVLYSGDNFFLGNVSSFIECLMIVITSLFVKKGKVICMTSPPLLPMFASIIYRIFNADWWLWSMDLFPEGFVANKTFKKESLVYKCFDYLTYRFAPKALISLGPSQAKFIEQNYKKDFQKYILPCGILKEENSSSKKEKLFDSHGKLVFGYCGNLGQAHSLTFIHEVFKLLDPDKHLFVLAVYGVKSHELKKLASNYKCVLLLDAVPRNELNSIDIHLVSLLEEWTHIAVPSKAVSSVTSGSTFLFYGSKQSDNWGLLKDAGYLISIEDDLKSQLGNFIEELKLDKIEGKRKLAIKVRSRLEALVNKSYSHIAQDL